MSARGKAQAAIEESIQRNSIVDLAGADLSEVLAAAEAMGYQTDHTDDPDGGLIDIWGWTDETSENEQDWRLHLVRG